MPTKTAWISVFRSSVRSHATHAIGELKNCLSWGQFSFSSSWQLSSFCLLPSFCEKDEKEQGRTENWSIVWRINYFQSKITLRNCLSWDQFSFPSAWQLSRFCLLPLFCERNRGGQKTGVQSEASVIFKPKWSFETIWVFCHLNTICKCILAVFFSE